ncbi:MAG TPA: 3-hydroxyacyl-CoA dehydrogenase NAD-binding domain-containing protein [Microbacteriaceae bacterium]|nr:3-hydroxyacyl-CoA dehydrogenase NAD-binding domain-containing protein [Microbacteriaceae bacterium]
MTNYRDIDFTPLLELSADEVVTHTFVRDIRMPSGKTIALVTLDNGLDHTRPNTLGPKTLLEYLETLDALAERANRGEIDAVATTGKPWILAAGADLSKVSEIRDAEIGKLMAQLGHFALGRQAELGVPSFVFINGLALGGGLEVALNAHYRTVDSSAAAIALPEVFLGLIPGWGGAYLLPNLIGIENALKVVIENPLKQNRTLSAADALELGIADVMFGPARFLEQSLAWADAVITGRTKVKRPNEPGKIERLTKWDIAIGIAEKSLAAKIGRVPRSPYAALELLKAAKSGSTSEGFAREDEMLAELISSDQLHASMYAFNLVQKRTKSPAGAPDPKLARPITKVGVLGAGYMASQIATLFARRLQVPVVITDLDQAHVDTALERIRGEFAALRDRGRISSDECNRLCALVQGTVDKADFADCDWVIEAVFEELEVKQTVFAQVEPYLAEDAIIATNTSSLSVEQIGAKLAHPERLVGFHFFTPVAVMPLVEVIRTPHTNEQSLSTAMVVAKKLKKNAVITADTPGFVVNRLLAVLLGEAMRAVDSGTDFATVDAAMAPLGLPMAPSVLLDLVGLRVGAHVLDTHHAAFPDRFYRSENLHKLADYGTLLNKDGKGKITGFDSGAMKIVAGGTDPQSAEAILTRLQDRLADETHRMLVEDHVVSAPEDIDLCMILGAGFPFQMGGLTPYLDRVGASERAFGDTFHHPMVRGAR